MENYRSGKTQAVMDGGFPPAFRLDKQKNRKKQEKNIIPNLLKLQNNEN